MTSTQRVAINQKIGRRVRELRERSGFSPGRFAQDIVATEHMLAAYEAGTRAMYCSQLILLSRFHNVPIDWFYEE